VLKQRSVPQWLQTTGAVTVMESMTESEISVGQRLRSLREDRDLSIRSLAQKSRLSVNTLSLIENGKTSPSVATLQQLAGALGVSMTAFFESGAPPTRLVYTKSGQRRAISFMHGSLENLGGGKINSTAQPFVVKLAPNASSGTQPIVHTGYEFVFCLKGRVVYRIEDHTYLLEPGDSILFESHLPHQWQNVESEPSEFLLMLCPSDAHDQPTDRHFSNG
jgi:transcriptional regulator with XRE-family HTH domain